jgi:hypothetical protein
VPPPTRWPPYLLKMIRVIPNKCPIRYLFVIFPETVPIIFLPAGHADSARCRQVAGEPEVAHLSMASAGCRG